MDPMRAKMWLCALEPDHWIVTKKMAYGVLTRNRVVFCPPNNTRRLLVAQEAAHKQAPMMMMAATDLPLSLIHISEPTRPY